MIECVGCRGLVPDIDGPIHRYMTASPGCWQAYAGLLASLPASEYAGLTVDAYAVTHPGVPGPQSTPSVWIHLLTLCLTLERGWPIERAVFLRKRSADSFAGWPWLPRPDRMGDVTAVDIAAAVAAGDLASASALTPRWVEGAWDAWRQHADAVRTRADELVRRLG